MILKYKIIKTLQKMIIIKLCKYYNQMKVVRIIKQNKIINYEKILKFLIIIIILLTLIIK